MANVNGIQTRVNTAAPQKAAAVSPLSAMVQSAKVQERFDKMLGKKSAGFLSSLLTLVNNNKLLQNAAPASILAAAGTAASLDLPINPSLGFAWIVPYKGAAQFQIGYKGLIQLAQKSGLMKKIVCCEVYEGELKHFNKFTEDVEFGDKTSDAVVGYYAMFELTNGFRKASYTSIEEVRAHAKKFSKAYNSGPWVSDFDAMAKKTVLSHLLRTFAPMSIEMQNAAVADEKVAQFNADTGEAEYIDVDITDDGRAVDVGTGEILEEAK